MADVEPASNSPEDVGFNHARRPAPVAALEAVRHVDGDWEATVRRSSGKRTWLYRKTEREVRGAALEEVRR